MFMAIILIILFSFVALFAYSEDSVILFGVSIGVVVVNLAFIAAVISIEHSCKKNAMFVVGHDIYACKLIKGVEQ